jgi:hypothetical protein
MKNTLIIPTQIQKAQPKPTKTQLVEALVAKAKEKWKQKLEESNKKQEAILKEIEDKAILFLAGRSKRPDASVDYQGGVSLRFEMNEPLFKKLGKQYKDANMDCWFNDDQVKKKIRDGLAAPNPLLDNPDVAVALDNLLTSIMNPGKRLTIEG